MDVVLKNIRDITALSTKAGLYMTVVLNNIRDITDFKQKSRPVYGCCL